MDVNELSAITANLGTIIAGIIYGIQIYGSYIATAQGTYPRAEMSSTDDLFAAYATANDFLKIYALESGTPMVYFSNLLSIARLYLNGISLQLANFGDILIAATTGVKVTSTANGSNIVLEPGLGGRVTVPSWANLFSIGASQSIQTALDAKANVFSGVTGTVYVSTTPGGSPTTAIGFNNGIRVS